MTAPRQTPGGQREDTALAVGATVGAIMTALSMALMALIGPAILRVLAGGNRATVGRRLNAEGAALVDEAIRQADTVLQQAEHQIVADTTDRINAVAPITTPVAPPPAGPFAAPVRPAAPNTIGQASVRVHFGPPPSRHAKPPIPAERPRLALPAGPSAAPSLTSVADSVRNAGLNALREADDMFRAAAEAATANHATGTRAAQKMLDNLAELGMTVFADSRGRQWDLASYCEMAVRTAASRLSLLTQLHLMGPRSMDLVVVDAPSGELGCRKCAPFEGKVLSLSGRYINGIVVSVVDANGARKSANVLASLQEALASGLLHPNCRHDLVPFVDGATHLPLVGAPRGFVRHGHPIYRVVIPDHDSASYKAQQKQRVLERVIRQQVAVKSVALTPLAKAQANRRLVAARANLAQHIATHHLTRQRYRENPAKAR